MKKKKTTKPQKRARKGAIKDLEPKSNPKGGLNFTMPGTSAYQPIVTPQLPGALKIDYHK